jgi:hypothetical protein
LQKNGPLVPAFVKRFVSTGCDENRENCDMQIMQNKNEGSEAFKPDRFAKNVPNGPDY